MNAAATIRLMLGTIGLYGVMAYMVALVGVTLALGGTASLASWYPARRAARVDPAEG